jgi:hypothetical protein
VAGRQGELTRRRRINPAALASISVSAALVLVAVVRMLSYSRTGEVGAWVRESFLGGLAYRPDSLASVRFFKILATPSIVAVQYFLFRALNRGHRVTAIDPRARVDRKLDFRSPWLRLVLTTLISLQWVVIEWAKFSAERFYPNSPHESAWVNAGVLLASQALAFWGMKYLSFDPLFKD